MKPSAAGKGDDCRIANFKQYRDNYDAIFKKKKGCQCIDCCGENPEHDQDCEYMLELTQDPPEIESSIISTEGLDETQTGLLSTQLAEKHYLAALNSKNI